MCTYLWVIICSLLEHMLWELVFRDIFFSLQIYCGYLLVFLKLHVGIASNLWFTICSAKLYDLLWVRISSQ